MTRTIQTARRPRRRAGFTLIEMLVVIAIIGVVIALSGAAYFYFTASQPVKNTQARIMAIEQLLLKHWNKVIQDAGKETPSPVAYQLAGGDAARAKVIWVKARLVEAFPMSFAEIQNCPVYANNLIPATPGMRKYNKTYNGGFTTVQYVAAKHQSQTEMATCLLLALSVDRGFGKALDLQPMQSDTDGDGMMELVDDWNQPLYFYRFPTDNPDLQNNAPPAQAGAAGATFRDPLDPSGTLVNPAWYASANKTTFESLFHPIKNAAGTVNYTIPVIASSGPDQQLGLSAPAMSTTAAGQTTDNIYSFKQQVGTGTKS